MPSTKPIQDKVQKQKGPASVSLASLLSEQSISRRLPAESLSRLSSRNVPLVEEIEKVSDQPYVKSGAFWEGQENWQTVCS